MSGDEPSDDEGGRRPHWRGTGRSRWITVAIGVAVVAVLAEAIADANRGPGLRADASAHHGSGAGAAADRSVDVPAGLLRAAASHMHGSATAQQPEIATVDSAMPLT